MRSRIPLFALLFALGSFSLPLAAHAGGIPFFGPIIDKSWFLTNSDGTQVQCALSWGALMIVINNIISFLLTLAIVFVAPIMIAYAGFLYVVNSVNPSGIAQAKKILWNTIIGIVVALAGWMIVDALMSVLYNGSLGPWYSLVSGGNVPVCLPQAGVASELNQAAGGGAPGVTTTGLGNLQSFGSGPCDANLLQQTLSNLSAAQATTFACLAQPESSCGSNLQNGFWNKAVPNSGGKASTAYGDFQVTLSGNHSCYETQACYTAAGVTGPLNCQNGFGPNGFTAGGDATVLGECITAASNLACNLSAAVCVLQNQGWGAWETDANSSAQQACITQHSGG